jgi:HAD superfamily hydrolase (TIGR01549 family)
MKQSDRDYDPRKIKGVFFDLYGTLFVYGDMDRAWEEWLKFMYGSLLEYGLKMTEDDFAFECDGFFTKPFALDPAAADGRTLDERRHLAFFRRLGLAVPDESITLITENSLAGWQRHIRFDEKAYAVLKELKGAKKLALISNFDHPPHVHRLMKEYALDRFFDQVLVSSEIGIAKPDPRVFALACGRAGLEAREVVFVGDSEEDDVAGARSAGCYPILVRRPGGRPKLDYTRDESAAPARAPAVPLGVVSSLTEIFKYL